MKASSRPWTPRKASVWNPNTVKPSMVPPMPTTTPKNIPDQLRVLGFNTLAALIERAELSNVLQSRGPFTVFAPTDKAFSKFIGKRNSLAY